MWALTPSVFVIRLLMTRRGTRCWIRLRDQNGFGLAAQEWSMVLWRMYRILRQVKANPIEKSFKEQSMRAFPRSIVILLAAVALTVVLPEDGFGEPCIRNGENYCKKCIYNVQQQQYRCEEVAYDAYCDCQDLSGGGCSYVETDWCDYLSDPGCPDPPFCPKSLLANQGSDLSPALRVRASSSEIEGVLGLELESQPLTAQRKQAVRKEPVDQEVELAEEKLEEGQ